MDVKPPWDGLFDAQIVHEQGKSRLLIHDYREGKHESWEMPVNCLKCGKEID